MAGPSASASHLTSQTTDQPLLVRALAGEQIPRPPVWLMRQAGRYLSEYRELKGRHSFLELCRSPELATEVTMQPIRIIDPDAAIIFADILLPAAGMGFEIDFAPGPKIANPIRTRDDILRLRPADAVKSTGFVLAAIRQVRAELVRLAGNETRKALLGFAGAPFTMACYLLDQQPFKHFERTPMLAAEDPDAFHRFLQVLTETTIDYLVAQHESGADALQLFESWGGILPEEDYRRYALPYVRRIVEALEARGARIIFYVNGSSHLVSAMRDSGAHCLSIDSRTPMDRAEDIVGPDVALQGNIDPVHLYRPTAEISSEVESLFGKLRRRSRFILNLGHGILQTTPRESAIAFVAAAKRGWGDPQGT